MSDVTRICAQCGEAGPLEARYCPKCGYDSTNGALTPQPNLNLPVAIGKAALPVLAGAATLALRAAWKLLQSPATQTAVQQAVQGILKTRPASPPAPQPIPPAAKAGPRRTIRIRSTWATGDANGVWRQGSSEHTIEIEE